VPGLIALAAGIAGWVAWPKEDSEVRRTLQAAERAAKAADDAMDQRWERETNPKPFFSKKTELTEIRNRLAGLAKLKQDKLNALNASREQFQRERFLERYLIAKAKIPSIGPGRKAQLTSFGIVDASDISYQRIIDNVPRFGPGLTNKLVAWRRKLEAGFKFNPAEGVDRNES
jgi:DNA-binding helix-hairpin-helix protein with protein kinase domain